MFHVPDDMLAGILVGDSVVEKSVEIAFEKLVGGWVVATADRLAEEN